MHVWCGHSILGEEPVNTIHIILFDSYGVRTNASNINKPPYSVVSETEDYPQSTNTPHPNGTSTTPSYDAQVEDTSFNKTEVEDPYLNETERQAECSIPEYEIMKDNLLLYNHAKLMAEDNRSSGKEYLVSIMFSHYDQNNNGALEKDELEQDTVLGHILVSRMFIRDFERVATNQDGKNGETPSVHDGKRSLHHKALFTHRPHVTRCPDLIGYLDLLPTLTHGRLSCDHHEGRQHGLVNLYGQTSFLHSPMVGSHVTTTMGRQHGLVNLYGQISFLHSPMVGSHVTTTKAETLADNTRRCKFRTVHSSDTYCSDVCLQIGHREHLSKLARGCSLGHMLQFDDADKDGRLNINEFYMAFSVSVVSLDKALEVNHLSARVGDNVEIKCDVTGTPPPPIVWRRNEADLSSLDEEEVRVFVDGSLYLTRIQLLHAGNYTCHAQRNKDVVQTHVLTVHTIPEVKVTPRIQSRRPGEESSMFCHVIGEPFPKYELVGNGTELQLHSIGYADTGAYMCQAVNIGGMTRDISSLVVQEEPTPTAPNEERRFFSFHDWGVSVYEPTACRLYHQIQATDIIPGTQEYVCGDKGINCSWGHAINVANRYVYVAQPRKDRILVISKIQMVVVDVVVTDKFPVELHYVPHLDQVWVLNWRSEVNQGIKTIQIIRDAAQKRKHHTVHPEPIDGQFDLVSGLFMPPIQKCIPDAESRHDDLLSSRLSYRRGPPRHTIPDGPQLVLSRGRDPLLMPGNLARSKWHFRRRIFQGETRPGDVGIVFGRTIPDVSKTDSIRIPAGLVLRHLVSYKTRLAFAASLVSPPTLIARDPETKVGEPTTAAHTLVPRGVLGGGPEEAPWEIPEEGSGEVPEEDS
uniref:Ig-like domain-containing protein n=1 Tax=Timema douglasi TaxID=61478 RepID=A0A7R8VJ06_TIMDO|nr:unnamed protein product [Timema douglasi]